MNPVDFFRERFAAAADPVKAAAQQAYMKSELRFHGVVMATVRAVARELAPHITTRAQLRAAVDALYATDWFDLRLGAIDLLERKRTLLRPADAGWLIELVRASACWAHVDWLATKVVPATLPDDRAPRLRKWGRDADFWVRRTALLAQLDELRAGGGDFELFAELAAAMLDERELFIRKAIGWVLRDLSKKRPQLTAGFVRQHRARMSGLTLREATRRLPEPLRRRLTTPATAAPASRPRGRARQRSHSTAPLSRS